MESLYCTIYIVDVSQNPEEVETVTSRIVQLIEDHGGAIKRNERWGKRRLAYPIRKRTSGYYVEIEFSAQSRLNIPQIIEKEYRINDRVLRYLTYVVTAEELMQRELSATRAQYQQDEEASEADADKDSSDEKSKEKDSLPIKKGAAKPASRQEPEKKEKAVKAVPAEESADEEAITEETEAKEIEAKEIETKEIETKETE